MWVGWGGGWLFVDMSHGTCSPLAVTVWTWTACRDLQTCRPRDPWTPSREWDKGGGEWGQPKGDPHPLNGITGSGRGHGCALAATLWVGGVTVKVTSWSLTVTKHKAGLAYQHIMRK